MHRKVNLAICQPQTNSTVHNVEREHLFFCVCVFFLQHCHTVDVGVSSAVVLYTKKTFLDSSLQNIIAEIIS